MHTVLVLGAGKIGRMVAHFLGTAGDYDLRVADALHESAASAVAHLGSAQALKVAFEDPRELDAAMRGAEAVISCAPFHKNPLIAERAAENGLHYFDLTEDVATTARVAELARGARTAFVPQCGLAPGFITIAAKHLISPMSSIQDVRLRVGALPRHPTGRLGYNLTWSTEGLINEYLNPCQVLEDGVLRWMPPLEQREEIRLDGVRYEAFNTSGGIGTLAETLKGRARNVSYKTIRYPGHCELIQFLLHDLGMRDFRQELAKIFERALPTTAQDQVVIFVNATGLVGGVFTERSYAKTIRHREIGGIQWSAIQITTAAGVCAAVDLVLAGLLPQQGFVRQEEVAWSDFIDNRFGRFFALD